MTTDTPTKPEEPPTTTTTTTLDIVPAKRPRELTPYTYSADDSPAALYMTTGAFEQLQRLASLMASSRVIPEHFQGNVADCFLVAAQAIRWDMDPFAVAQNTFVVRGKLGYEGKLIAAMINTRPQMDGRLEYTYSGSGNQRTITVSGKLRGNPKVREVEGSFQSWHTKGKDGNVSDAWARDPDQMLAYRGARQWARRWMPEVILGVLSVDEVKDEVVDIEATPDVVPSEPVSNPPSKRLDDLAEKLRNSPDPPEVAAQKAKSEVTSIIEGQLKRSIEIEKAKRDVKEGRQSTFPDRDPGEEG
jgi:hypothetical protein